MVLCDLSDWGMVTCRFSYYYGRSTTLTFGTCGRTRNPTPPPRRDDMVPQSRILYYHFVVVRREDDDAAVAKHQQKQKEHHTYVTFTMAKIIKSTFSSITQVSIHDDLDFSEAHHFFAVAFQRQQSPYLSASTFFSSTFLVISCILCHLREPFKGVKRHLKNAQ